MFHRNRLIQGLAFALVLMALAVTTAQAQKKRPRSVSSGPPFVELAASRNTIRVCAGEDSTVRLNARATTQSGNPLRYKWATDGGRITGDGADTTWDLGGMRPGVYRATLEVDSGYDETCAAFTSAAVLVTDCPVVAPSCPTVSINCPDTVAFDQLLTFSANITGGSALLPPELQWTVSAGQIVEGQGTRTIKVDPAGTAGQTITASVDVRVAGLSCPAHCTVSVSVPRPECRKFDEFPKLPRNDEKARLDNFAIDLQNTPGSSAYIVVYPGRASRIGETEQHTNRIVDYLVSYRGIDAGRIIRLIGPVGPDFHVELWTCPPGVRPSGLLR